jgi:signal transduction histidine kinase
MASGTKGGDTRLLGAAGVLPDQLVPGLVARVSLTLVWLAYEWRVRPLRRAYEATLDARVAERTRIARELHDTLLKSFQALALRFQAALNVLPDRPSKAEARLTAALGSR